MPTENNATKSILEIIGLIVLKAEITKYETAFKNLVENALQDGRVLLLIDGLDEISNERHRVCFANQLRTFVATYPGAHLLITSREAGFRAVAGTIATYCRQYSIRELEKEQIRLLSLKWHQAILGDSKQVKIDSDKLCDMILGDARIVALAENPLLLTTLLFVKRCVGYLPTKRCRLYEEMIRLLLVTWNAAAHDKLDMDETEPQLAFVAYCMMEQGQQKITRDELKNCIIRARKELPEILDYTTVSPCKFIGQVEERSSLLIQTGYEENHMGQMIASYEFSHLSFQEYLAAKAIVKQWVPDSRNMNLLKAIKPHMTEEHWREVIPLAAFLSGRDAQPLIEELVQVNEAHESMDAKRSGYRQYKESKDDIIALHLANCIANEVPVNKNLLKKGILLIIKRKRALDKIQRIQRRNGLFDSINVFDMIAKSKYGNSYHEMLKNGLFENYEDGYAYEFSDLWMRWFLLENEDACNFENILLLLKSEEDQKKVTGALLMMHVAFKNQIVLRGTGINHKDAEIIKEIFSCIYKMLNIESDLYIYVSVWCIAWSGYGEAAIEKNFSYPQNDQDKRAAIHMAVVTKQWSRDEIKDRIKQISPEQLYKVNNSRLLKKMKLLPKSNEYKR